MLEAGLPLTRRRALKLGAGVTAGLIGACTIGNRAAWGSDNDGNPEGTAPGDGARDHIQNILNAEGSVSDGVFTVEIDRNDLTGVMWHGVPITPSFQLNGSFVFQSLGGTSILMNADFCLKPEELNPWIQTLADYGITVQAEHQHMYDFDPLVWFVHFRAAGDEEWICRGVKDALSKTSTPFPQSKPNNPTTPLPAREIGAILGAKPQISSDGVVGYNIPRKETMWLGGHKINPYLNVQTNIYFQPHGGGQDAIAIPDYGMIASEINNVFKYARGKGWDIGCLYNQETDEQPQLYFSHQAKVGGSIELAREIRGALNMTNVKSI